MALIRTSGLGVPGRLFDVRMSVEPGEMLGVIGPNGSGKSTLLHCLAGVQPHSGDCRFEDTEVVRLPPRLRARQIGLLPQSCDAAWSLRVEDVVGLGRLPWGDRDPAAIREAMDEVGVSGLADRRVDRLSGGERARVWLARVLAGRPRLLLADEPIASLDLQYQGGVMETLRRHADRGNGVVLAIHDLGLAARHCDRLCLMAGGTVRAIGAAAEVLTEEGLGEVFRVPVRVDLRAQPPVVVAR